MPQGKRIEAWVDDRIKAIWLRNTSQTVFAVWSTLCQGLGQGVSCPSQRHVASVLSPLRKIPAQSFDEEPLLEPWGDGWPCDPDCAEEIECLFRLYHASVEYKVFPLTHRIAQWGLKLRKVFAGPVTTQKVDLDLELLHFAFDYGLREKVAEAQGKPPSYKDLDGMVTYRIWESPDKFHQYREALKAGLVVEYDTSTWLKDEAALYGWENVVEAFVKGAFWPLSRAHGFRFVGSGDSEEDGLGDKGAYIKAAIRSINVLHMVWGEPDVVTAIDHWIQILDEDLEAAAQKATIGSKLEEYFKNWLTWWRELKPTLTQWIQNGVPEDRDQNSEAEEFSNAWTPETTIQG